MLRQGKRPVIKQKGFNMANKMSGGNLLGKSLHTLKLVDLGILSEGTTSGANKLSLFFCSVNYINLSGDIIIFNWKIQILSTSVCLIPH